MLLKVPRDQVPPALVGCGLVQRVLWTKLVPGQSSFARLYPSCKDAQNQSREGIGLFPPALSSCSTPSSSAKCHLLAPSPCLVFRRRLTLLILNWPQNPKPPNNHATEPRRNGAPTSCSLSQSSERSSFLGLASPTTSKTTNKDYAE